MAEVPKSIIIVKNEGNFIKLYVLPVFIITFNLLKTKKITISEYVRLGVSIIGEEDESDTFGEKAGKKMN